MFFSEIKANIDSENDRIDFCSALSVRERQVVLYGTVLRSLPFPSYKNIELSPLLES